jgi:hypothetical protein
MTRVVMGFAGTVGLALSFFFAMVGARRETIYIYRYHSGYPALEIAIPRQNNEAALAFINELDARMARHAVRRPASQ